MSFFVRAQHTPARLSAALTSTVTYTAPVLMPVFFGLAAIAPATIELLGGDRWAPAGQIAAALALASAVAGSTHFLMTALAARGLARAHERSPETHVGHKIVHCTLVR